VDIGTRSSLGGSFQIWADLDMLPIKSNIGTNRHTSSSITWHFDRLDSEIMIPRLPDVQAAISREEVVTQINRGKFNFKKRLYMITGVRVARGAKLRQKESGTVGGNAGVGVDLGAFGIAPVTVGVGGAGHNTSSKNYGFKKSTDFVFAYRVCEIHYGKDVYVKPYNSGETFGTNDGRDEDGPSEDEEDEDKPQRIVVEDIETSDYSGGGVPHKSFTLAVDDKSWGLDEEEFVLADDSVDAA